MENNCALKQNKDDGDATSNDFVLKENCDSVWITINNISVYVRRTDEEVSVDLFEKGTEMGKKLASATAAFPEAQCCSKDEMIDQLLDADYFSESRAELVSEIKKYKYKDQDYNEVLERWKAVIGNDAD